MVKKDFVKNILEENQYLKRRIGVLKRGVIVLGIFMIFFIVILSFIGFNQMLENTHVRVQKEAVEDLFMFSLNVSNYCAESNNMTYQELLDNYVINFTAELLKNGETRT